MSFGPLGVPELLFILVLALLIFGPKRLPDVGRTIGKSMSEFRKATSDLKRTIEREIDINDTGTSSSSRSSASLPAKSASGSSDDAQHSGPESPSASATTESSGA